MGDHRRQTSHYSGMGRRGPHEPYTTNEGTLAVQQLLGEGEAVSLQVCPSYLNHALVDDPTPLSKQEIRTRGRLGSDRDQNTLYTHIKVLQ